MIRSIQSFFKNGSLEKYVDYNDKGAKQICDYNKQGGKYVFISSSYSKL